MKNKLDEILDALVNTGINLLLAIIVIVIGFKLVSILLNLIGKGKAFNKLEKTVQTFIMSLISIVLKILIFIIAAGIVGIPMTSIITLVGSASLAIGLALQGGLSNLAGGLMLLIFRPFKVGDFIDVSNYSGSVKSITLFYTSIVTLDNKLIMLPNGSLSNSIITNYSTFSKRRVDLLFSVGYDSNIDKVKEIITSVAESHELVLKDEKIFVGLKEHGASALVFECRVWTKKDDYFNVKFDLTEEIKKAFDKSKIEIPYQTIDVNIRK